MPSPSPCRFLLGLRWERASFSCSDANPGPTGLGENWNAAPPLPRPAPDPALLPPSVEGSHWNEGLLLGRPPEEPEQPLTENSLLEVLDGAIMMYNLSVHQQLGKVVPRWSSTCVVQQGSAGAPGMTARGHVLQQDCLLPVLFRPLADFGGRGLSWA